ANAAPVSRFAPRLSAAKTSRSNADGNVVASPMHGIIVAMNVAEGDAVSEGQVVAVIEAMKMMNEIRAHRRGTVARVHAGVGDAIESGSALVTMA
ncbi:MAG: acetyl-CoA carboxylase biotin carboxyl carrier protein subunit, partial [Candidatus Tumulicola sp.]